MIKKNNWAMRIWEILYPLLMYYAVIVMVMFLAQSFLGTGEKNYMLCQIIASLVAIPVIYRFYRQDKREKIRFSKEIVMHGIWIVVIALCIATALNNLILMTPIAEISQGFQEANRNFYGSSMVLEIFGAALITPLLEELLYRGVIYGRLRDMAGTKCAVILSACLFALIHFNLVQSLYAFLLGIVLALLTEKTGHMYGAVIAHIVANTIAVIRTETGFLKSTTDKSVFAWTISIILLVIGVGILIFYLQRNNKEKE